MLFTRIDRASPTSLRRQLYEQWRHQILSGARKTGEKVPSTRELAATLGLSRATVTEAFEQLIAEGYLETEHGSGTFVCRHLPEPFLETRSLRSSKNSDTQTAPVRLSAYGSGLGELVRPATRYGVIHFDAGRPDVSQFPFDVWRRLLNRHLRRGDRSLFDYADNPAGHAGLRAEVAKYLARARAVTCTPEQVVIVSGSQQAIDLSVRLLLNPGETVAVENPGYLVAQRILAAHGARLRSLPVDKEGVVVRSSRGSLLPKQTRLIYVTPSHQFPTGVAMSVSRRLELLEAARNLGAVILEDDYSSEFRYDGGPLPALQGLASDVPVLYMGTFSKAMYPGLRLGYLVVPRQLVETFRRAKWVADRHCSMLDQAAAADFLAEGWLDRHIRRMRRLYAKRRESLLTALDQHFGVGATCLGDAAGMHVMVRFRSRYTQERARKNGVSLLSAHPLYLRNPPGNEYLFGFASLPESAIREGIRRLAG